VLAAATNYEKSKVQLDLFTATTISQLGINMNEAESGKVQKMPKVPGIVPGSPQTAPNPSQPQPSQAAPQPQQ